MSFIRFIYVVFVILKFRLDEFFESRFIFLIRCLLFPIRIFQSKKISRAIRLRRALENLGPIFVKFGQMLSTRRDLIPPDISDELSKLQDQVPPFSFNEVKKIIEKEYSGSLKSVFIEFNKEPEASASVAQVHFAELIDGTKVAVKVLRPKIANAVKKDIRLLGWLAYILEIVWSDGKRLKPREVVKEFSRHTDSELNLLLEAAHCSHLGQNFSDKKLLLVPEVFWDYCNEQVMVMERMYGTPVSNINSLAEKGIDIPKLATDGVEIFFTQVFRDGFFHADMHPGNIQVADDGRYIAMDFGIMGSLTEKDKQYLARNFVCFFKRNYRGVAEVHIESGWVPADTSIDDFENAIRSVCEPIFNKPLKEISFGKLLIRLFQTSRKFNMEIQPQLTMLQKTLLNVEGLGRELDPNLDLWNTASPFLEKWLKEETGPKNIIKNLKKEFPGLIDNIPKLPKLLKAYLENNNFTSIQTNLTDVSGQVKKLNKITRALSVIILCVLIAGSYFLFTTTVF